VNNAIAAATQWWLRLLCRPGVFDGVTEQSGCHKRRDLCIAMVAGHVHSSGCGYNDEFTSLDRGAECY
jgi:hypothetical protein